MLNDIDANFRKVKQVSEPAITGYIYISLNTVKDT
jgi:hypothetical protein